MKIVHANPPMLDEIDAVFKVRGRRGTVFAFGDTIFAPTSKHIDPAIIAHEEVHGARQAVYPGGVIAWWRAYIADPAFRLAEEIHSHRAEYAWHVRNANGRGSREKALTDIAVRLSGPVYGRLISFAKAKALLVDPESAMPIELQGNKDTPMGIAQVKDAFNAVSGARYSASRATLGYERDDKGVEWQILTFSGIGADGVSFTTKSPRLAPQTDLLVAARAAAQALLDQEVPQS